MTRRCDSIHILGALLALCLGCASTPEAKVDATEEARADGRPDATASAGSSADRSANPGASTGGHANDIVTHRSASPEAVREGEVRRAKDLRTRAAPSGRAFMSPLARGERAFVGKLVLAPGARIPAHRDTSEEYVYILGGGGTVVLDGERHVVGAGDTVFMPAGVEVSYENGPEATVVLQIFAGPGSADRYEAWELQGGAGASGTSESTTGGTTEDVMEDMYER